MHIRDNQVIFEKSETSDKNGWSNGQEDGASLTGGVEKWQED